MANKQSKGTCAYCGKELSKAGMTKHLATCPQRQEAIAKAETKKGTANPFIIYAFKTATAVSFGLI